MSLRVEYARVAVLVLVVASLLLAALSASVPAVQAQDDVATVIIAPVSGGTTNPSPGTYTYANGTDIELLATPNSGFEFLYWVVSGGITPGHTQGNPSYIIDPETGEIIGNIPTPPQPTEIDSIIFTTNPATITCGYGYTYTYQAVFATENGTAVEPDEAVVIIQPSTGGTTDPAAGTYTYANGTDITLTATPESGYTFSYWVASGTNTPGHTDNYPTYIVDPETGEIIGSIPTPPATTGINSLTFTTNPTTITCGYGYTYTYQAVFMAEASPSPSPTVTPSPTATSTPTESPSPDVTPTATPEDNPWLSTEMILIIVVAVIVIIIVIAAIMMRR